MSLRWGYLVPQFPEQTHAFFWREVCSLRRMGEQVLLVSTRKPSPLTCRHEFVPTAVAETHYLYPFGVRSLLAWAAVGSRSLSQALVYLLGLVDWARRERIDHIHGHSCADTAHVLALARRAGGPPYSLTLHGDLEVYG